MGVLDRVKQVAVQVCVKVKEIADELQAKRTLGHAYQELGRKAYELIASGELKDAGLSAQADEIRGLRERREGESPSASEPAPAPSTPPAEATEPD